MKKRVSEIAETILRERYYAPGEDWHGLCKRVSNFMASAEKDADKEFWAKKFYNILYNLEFLPNSPTLMNAGTRVKNLSACFVLPVKDSMEEIFDALKTTALIHASGGGTGFDFSELRPAGSVVKSTNGTTSGPISFLKVFDAATNVIKQGGRRRGANMAVFRCDHLDIEEFVKCKTEEGDISNFNVSVAITDKFMQACEKNEEFVLNYNTKELDPKTIKANDLMDLIVEGAWKNGEPGLLFIDTVNRLSKIDEEIRATNPCGEIPLPPYGSCNLGSINLLKCLKGNGINWDKLDELVRIGIRFLDNVVTLNEYPDHRIKKATMKYRPLGLGIMGYADLLIIHKIRYGSPESYDLINKLMERIVNAANDASRLLCETKGENKEGKGRRNSILMSIAPTGSISLIAGCSSSIEPNFAWEYESHRVDRVFKHYHPLVKEYLHHNIEKTIATLPDYFVTTLGVSPIQHVDTQATFQKYVDHAISKTINLSKDATREQIRDVFFHAWRCGCKGITVYRDGSREEQVLVSTQKKEIVSTTKYAPVKRVEKLKGITVKKRTDKGSIYITVNFMNNALVEVFLNAGILSSSIEGLSRLISLALRSNISPLEISTQLRASGGDVEEVIASIIEEYGTSNGEKCPECGEKLTQKAGCIECESCGYGKCTI